MGRLDTVASIADLRRIARRKLRRPIFEWMDGGAFEERTLNANRTDMEKLVFRQRVGIDISERKLSTELLGRPASIPVAISPTGMSGIVRDGGKGEILAARAAARTGVPFTLGMVSMAPIERIREEVEDFWFQICLLKDRELFKEMVGRAEAAGCPVLVLTMTWPILSQMNRMVRSRHSSLPPAFTPANVLTYALKPAWSLRALGAMPFKFGNFEAHWPGEANLPRVVEQLDDAITWADVEWVRSIWPGKLLLKGIMTAEDARHGVAAGADGVSVSNHGGNMLDPTTSTIAALPHVLDGVNGRAEVLLDGGIRSGQDVLRALALGAKGCLLGRAHLFGLAAAGEAGVTKALEMIRTELSITAGLAGLNDVTHATREILA